MTKQLTPLKAIKEFCKYTCCANDLISWKECSLRGKCPLYPYRLGKRHKTPTSQDSTKKQGVLHKEFTKNEGVENDTR